MPAHFGSVCPDAAHAGIAWRGMPVVVFGLKAQPQWNGVEGEVVSAPVSGGGDVENGRFEVRMNAQESLRIKGANFWV